MNTSTPKPNCGKSTALLHAYLHVVDQTVVVVFYFA